MLSHLLIGPNKIYLAALILLILFLYKTRKNLLESLWLAFLAAFPFGRGRYFEYSVIPGNYLQNSFGMNFSVPVLFSDLLIALMLYLLLTRYWKLRGGVYRSGKYGLLLFILLLLILISALISVFVSDFPFTTSIYFLQLSKYFLLFLIASVVFKTKGMFIKTFQVITVFVFLNSLLIILQYLKNGYLGTLVESVVFTYGFYDDESRSVFRPGGIYTDPNIAATLVSMILPVFLLNLISTDKIKNYLSWTAFVVFIFSLIFTYSRTAWLVTVLSAYLLLRKLHMSGNRIYISKTAYKTIAVFAAAFLLLLPKILARISTLVFAFTEEGGGAYRLNHLAVGWYFIKSNLLGIGIGSFPYKMYTDFPSATSGLMPAMPHNMLVQIAAEIGLFGLISFICFFGVIIWRKLELLKSSGFSLTEYGFFISFAVLMFAGLLFPWILHPNLSYYYWIFAAYYKT